MLSAVKYSNQDLLIIHSYLRPIQIIHIFCFVCNTTVEA